jgi:hypothetical protein
MEMENAIVFEAMIVVRIVWKMAGFIKMMVLIPTTMAYAGVKIFSAI